MLIDSIHHLFDGRRTFILAQGEGCLSVMRNSRNSGAEGLEYLNNDFFGRSRDLGDVKVLATGKHGLKLLENVIHH